MNAESSHEHNWTPRQREVLDLIANGRTNPEIAETLGISLAGAKWHVSEVISILGVTRREDVAAYWRSRNRWHRRLGRTVRALLPVAPLKMAAGAAGVTVIGGAALVGGSAVGSGDGPAATHAEVQDTNVVLAEFGTADGFDASLSLSASESDRCEKLALVAAIDDAFARWCAPDGRVVNFAQLLHFWTHGSAPPSIALAFVAPETDRVTAALADGTEQPLEIIEAPTEFNLAKRFVFADVVTLDITALNFYGADGQLIHHEPVTKQELRRCPESPTATIRGCPGHPDFDAAAAAFR